MQIGLPGLLFLVLLVLKLTGTATLSWGWVIGGPCMLAVAMLILGVALVALIRGR